MTKPSITIIIPTRERHETLGASIRTCVEQDYADLEILVSDNASEDSTKDTVSRFKDPRLRYIRAPKRLSMTENFCFGLEHARGTYMSRYWATTMAFSPGRYRFLLAGSKRRMPTRSRGEDRYPIGLRGL
jgi:glycosyltransferase involved in cell wall biosynthesis